jgi:glycerol-3-phosphate dehydrogenase
MMDHLLHRYGSLVSELIETVDAEPGLGNALAGAPAYLRAEIAYAVTHEGALHLDDVLMHRTRLNYEQADRGVGALDEIADIITPLLGWDDETRAREIDAYRQRAEAEAAAELELNDESAEQVRLKATEIAPLHAVATP